MPTFNLTADGETAVTTAADGGSVYRLRIANDFGGGVLTVLIDLFGDDGYLAEAQIATETQYIVELPAASRIKFSLSGASSPDLDIDLAVIGQSPNLQLGQVVDTYIAAGGEEIHVVIRGEVTGNTHGFSLVASPVAIIESVTQAPAPAGNTLAILTPSRRIEADESVRVGWNVIGVGGGPTGNWAVNGQPIYMPLMRIRTDAAAIATVREVSAKLTDARLAKIDLIGTGSALNGGAPITDAGQLTELVIGDDYAAANGRALSWTVDMPTGGTVEGARCFFGGAHTDPLLAGANRWLVEGVVSAGPTAGKAVITFDLLGSHTQHLIGGDYEYSAEIRNDAGLESTMARSKKTRRVTLVEKQT